MIKPAYKPFKSWWVYRNDEPWEQQPTLREARERASNKAHFERLCFAVGGRNKYTVVRVLVTPQKGKP